MTLAEALAGHAAADADEAAHLGRIVEFVGRHATPFDRRIPEGHLTGSALVVSAGADRVLLVHHRKLQRWLQPGGHADPGETAGEVVALREARRGDGDLAGSRCTPAPRGRSTWTSTPSRPSGPSPRTRTWTCATSSVAPEVGVITRRAAESSDARWFGWDELAAPRPRPRPGAGPGQGAPPAALAATRLQRRIEAEAGRGLERHHLAGERAVGRVRARRDGAALARRAPAPPTGSGRPRPARRRVRGSPRAAVRRAPEVRECPPPRPRPCSAGSAPSTWPPALLKRGTASVVSYTRRR